MKSKALKIQTNKKEKEMLKLTIDVLANDNAQLKKSFEEMQKEVKANKAQLQEYLSKITDRDTAVKNLNNTIDLLRQQLNDISTQNKSKQNNALNTDSNANNTLEAIQSPISHRIPITQRDKSIPLSLFNQPRRSYDIDKYKDYCAKQNQLMEEITKLKYELNALILRNKCRDNGNYVLKRAMNLKEAFDEGCLSKITQSLKEKSQYYLVDNLKRVWQIVRRKALNEVNIHSPAILDRKSDIEEDTKMSMVNIKDFWPQKASKPEFRIICRDNKCIDNGPSLSVKDMMKDPYFI